MSRTILIAHNDEDACLIMSELLLRRGFDAKAVASGDDCLNYAARLLGIDLRSLYRRLKPSTAPTGT